MPKPRQAVRLGELDYLRLTHHRDKVQAALVEGQESVRAAVEAAERVVAVARESFGKQFQSTAAKYRFDPSVSYRFDDKKRLLIPENGK